jgi:hypothetical protein
MECKVLSTVQDLTGELEGAKVPMRYLEAKICKSGMGSSMDHRKGLHDKSWQKVSHMFQLVSVEVALPWEMPKVAAFLIVLSSLTRFCHWGDHKLPRRLRWEALLNQL